MKKRLKLLFLALLCVLMLMKVSHLPLASASEQERSVTILFTHDLHDSLLPVKTLDNDSIVSLGGYAKLKSAIDLQKAIAPDALLVDAGDYSMGTPFQTIYSSDAPELRIMGAMGYDVTTFGNHEFDYRPAGLTDSLNAAINSKELLPQLVQSNMRFPTDKDGNMTESLTKLKKAMEDYGVQDYVILERGGVKIGIFGLLGEESASMAPMSEVTFADAVKEAKRVVKLLKEKEEVDVILCLSHSGTVKEQSKSEDVILAQKVPEIDVIISGHTHSKLSQPIVIGNTVIGSAQEYGKNLAVLKLVEEDENWELENYQLIAIDDSFPEEQDIKEKVAEFKDIVQEKYFDKFQLDYDKIIARSKVQFQTTAENSTLHKESNIGNLISDAYVYAVQKAEGENYQPIAAAIVPSGTIRETIYKGDISTADAFSISSLGIGADGMPGYPLLSVYITGKELKTVCEVDASITPLMNEAQLYMSGLNFTFNPNRLIFNKVTETQLINPDGTVSEIVDNQLYRVVCGLYSAQMLSVVGDKSYGLMSIVPKNAQGEVISDFEQYIIYDSTNGNKKELKEWYAIAKYIQSFETDKDIALVPEYYQEELGRKVIDDNRDIVAILSNPNHISLTVYIAIPTILLLVLFLILRKRNRRGRKRRSRRSRKMK